MFYVLKGSEEKWKTSDFTAEWLCDWRIHQQPLRGFALIFLNPPQPFSVTHFPTNPLSGPNQHPHRAKNKSLILIVCQDNNPQQSPTYEHGENWGPGDSLLPAYQTYLDLWLWFMMLSTSLMLPLSEMVVKKWWWEISQRRTTKDRYQKWWSHSVTAHRCLYNLCQLTDIFSINRLRTGRPADLPKELYLRASRPHWTSFTRLHLDKPVGF